ncbi:MAG TPA: hypothetical protein VF631_13365 [Allosphingosinicella sp.]|jgi:hypothetical protein|uniref:hypothetical protein n=1 Tax=Allosphingosinicella sp. TaxID=2823234 RepID=UPI002F280F46
MIATRIGLAAVLMATAQEAFAQSVTLTVDDGRPLVVGGSSDLGAALTATSLAPVAVSAEFRRLCLSDPATAGTRVAGSVLALVSDDALFAAEGKRGEARVARWKSPSAELAVWTGDDANLKGRPIAMPSRGSTTTGPYGPFRADGTQCNLVVMLTDLAAAQALAAALTAAFGTPGKLVSKKSFADGFWQVAGTNPIVRINFTAPSVRGGPQPVHLSAQVMKKGKR